MNVHWLITPLFLVPLLLMTFLNNSVSSLVNTWFGFPILFYFFLTFVIGLLGWGSLLERKLGGGWAGTFLYASGLGIVIPFLLGSVGLLGYSLRFLPLAILAVGIYLFAQLRQSERLFQFQRSWCFGIIGFVFFLRALAAFLPQAHGDPLLYHLLGPRLWVLEGSAKVYPDLPNAILSSYWEYLYVWAQWFWMQEEGVQGMVASQIFSQWTHLFFGWFGIALFMERFSRRFFQEDLLRLLVILASLFVANIHWTAGLAKNDAGMAFFALGAWWLFQEGMKSQARAHFLASGIFAGIAVGGKINSLVFLGPFIGLSFLFFSRENFRKAISGLSFFCAAFLVGLLPVLIRNWLQTSNPFYPMFSNVFPSPWISLSWMEFFSQVEPSQATGRMGVVLYRLGQAAKESITNFGWLLLPAFFFVASLRAKLKDYSLWLGSSALVFVIFCFAFGGEVEFRYLGATLVVLSVSGLILILTLIQSLVHSEKGKVALYWILLVALLGASKLPTHLLWKFPKMSPGEAHLKTHTAGDSKEWLRAQMNDRQLVVLVADNEAYYLSNKHVTVITERADIDRAVRDTRNWDELVAAVCNTSGATYLLEVRNGLQKFREASPLPSFQSAVVFEGVSSRVIDLRKLRLFLKPNAGKWCDIAKPPRLMF